MREFLEPLPLPEAATFADLVFRPHPDEWPDHQQALHHFKSGRISVTVGGMNFGEPGAPYEAMTPDGKLHYPLTEDGVTALLRV